jgi:hypothetical protein
LRLSEEGIADTATSVFFKTPVPAQSGRLIIEYTVYFTHSGVTGQPVTGDPDPGDGLTMTVVAGIDPSLVGGPGADLGYGGITQNFDGAVPSLAVEADSWTDDFFNEGTGSPTNDGTWHLGIDTGGNVQSVALKSSGLPDIFRPEGVRHTVVITSEGKVSVFVAPGGEGAGAGGGNEPVLEAEIEPLSGQGDTEAVIGFTGATGEGTQTSEVGDILVTVIECSDIQETAEIEFEGENRVQAGRTVVFDASGSTSGPGDEDEDLTFRWEASGAGEISGPADGPTVAIIVGDGDAIARVTVDDNRCANFVTKELAIVGGNEWVTYDANSDGVMNMSDAIFHLAFQFSGGPTPACLTALDFNDDGRLDISDPVAVLKYLFGSEPPQAPSPVGLGCRIYPHCGAGPGCDG